MAVQLLFQSSFASVAVDTRSAAEMLRRFSEYFEMEPEVADYGGELFLGVVHHLSEIDAVIERHSAHWKVARMGLVDLSVMRVAVFEMKFLEPRLNPKIAIDEAIEIAKCFGSTESGAFVNGILDHVARTL
jgi:N utilization substance protein B